MSIRCYYRKGGKEFVAGVICETKVADESEEKALFADGWVRSIEELDDDGDTPDEALKLLRETAKERGIKGWQRMGEPKLREVLGLDDGNDEE
jgi:type II secretory pathway predicted ATPase ExeA